MKPITPTQLVEIVADALGDLRAELVFVGGAITGFLLTDPAAPSPSATKDVDVIISVATPTEYLDKLDLMPTDPDILGFSNRWFPEAFRSATARRLGNGLTIRLVTGPLFLATKLEAFYSRGKGDCIASKDMEDLIAVLHGREEIVAEVAQTTDDVRRFLAEEAGKLLACPAFIEALPGHLPGEDVERVMVRLAQIQQSS